MMQKRTALKLVLAGAAAAMLAGCGDKTEAPKEAAAPGKTPASCSLWRPPQATPRCRSRR